MSRLYNTEHLPNVGSLALATSCWGDAMLNEALFHDFSVQAPSLASISENTPIGNAHELTSLFTVAVAALLATTKDNFHIPNFGSDEDDKGNHIDASICKPEDNRKSAAKTDDDDVNVDNDDYDAIFDSGEEKEDNNPGDDDYVEDENNDEDDEEEEEVEVVGTTMSINPVDELLSPDLAAFFANNENFEDNDDAMVNDDDDNSGLDNIFCRGGPKKTDLQNVTIAAAALAMEQYQKECKAFTDCKRRRCLKESEDYYDVYIKYTGCVLNKLQLMTEVAADHVLVGQNFPTKKIVSLQFAEEAIQVSKHVVFGSSDATKLTAKGNKFECTANKRDGLGWVVTEFFVNVCGKGISEQDHAGRNVKPALPLRATWLIDLLLEQIWSTPNISNNTMRKFCLGYMTEYAITDNLLQKVWSDGKAVIFGSPSLNVQYCHVLKQEMEERGNPVEFFLLTIPKLLWP